MIVKTMKFITLSLLAQQGGCTIHKEADSLLNVTQNSLALSAHDFGNLLTQNNSIVLGVKQKYLTNETLLVSTEKINLSSKHPVLALPELTSLIARDNALSSRLALRVFSWNPVDVEAFFPLIEKLDLKKWTKEQWEEVLNQVKTHVKGMQLLTHLPKSMQKDLKPLIDECRENYDKMQKKSGEVYVAIKVEKDSETAGSLYSFTVKEDLIILDKNERKKVDNLELDRRNKILSPAMEKKPFGTFDSKDFRALLSEMGCIKYSSSFIGGDYYSGRYSNSFRVPDIVALKERWGKFKLKQGIVNAPVRFCDSEGIQSPLDFIDSFIDGCVLLSNQEEFNHDWGTHINVALKNMNKNLEEFREWRAGVVAFVRSTKETLVKAYNEGRIEENSFKQLISFLSFYTDAASSVTKDAFAFFVFDEFRDVLFFWNRVSSFRNHLSKKYGDKKIKVVELANTWSELKYEHSLKRQWIIAKNKVISVVNRFFF